MRKESKQSQEGLSCSAEGETEFRKKKSQILIDASALFLS